jgi:hypothetical protein
MRVPEVTTRGTLERLQTFLLKFTVSPTPRLGS